MKYLLFSCVLLASCVAAHMQLLNPLPIRSPLNTADNGPKDYSYTNPLSASGSDFPCKGYANDPFQSVADYTAGKTYELAITGSATHGGGSCQISLSYDKGKSFHVIHSMLGGCPLKQSYNFQIPTDAPSGQALLVWTWFNKIGNREMYMNCAQVTIHGGKTREHPRDLFAKSPARTPFNNLPSIFVANVNVNNGPCSTIEGEEVNFPEPGDSVEGKLAGQGFTCKRSAAEDSLDVKEALPPHSATALQPKSLTPTTRVPKPGPWHTSHSISNSGHHSHHATGTSKPGHPTPCISNSGHHSHSTRTASKPGRPIPSVTTYLSRPATISPSMG